MVLIQGGFVLEEAMVTEEPDSIGIEGFGMAVGCRVILIGKGNIYICHVIIRIANYGQDLGINLPLDDKGIRGMVVSFFIGPDNQFIDP